VSVPVSRIVRLVTSRRGYLGFLPPGVEAG
jgi:hypothetical protein